MNSVICAFRKVYVREGIYYFVWIHLVSIIVADIWEDLHGLHFLIFS